MTRAEMARRAVAAIEGDGPEFDRWLALLAQFPAPEGFEDEPVGTSTSAN